MVDCKIPFLFPLIKVSPISNLLSSSSISKIGNWLSAIILPDEVADMNVPGTEPVGITLLKLYLTVPKVPPILGSVAFISNKDNLIGREFYENYEEIILQIMEYEYYWTERYIYFGKDVEDRENKSIFRKEAQEYFKSVCTYINQPKYNKDFFISHSEKELHKKIVYIDKKLKEIAKALEKQK